MLSNVYNFTHMYNYLYIYIYIFIYLFRGIFDLDMLRLDLIFVNGVIIARIFDSDTV